jgi:predicted acyl esterase
MKIFIVPTLVLFACLACSKTNQKKNETPPVVSGDVPTTDDSDSVPKASVNEIVSTSIVISNHMLKTEDRVSIDMRIYEPDAETFPGKRPSILFISSWALDKFEYELQAKRFAAKGYLVASCTPRGFGRSGGLVSAAGPQDQSDMSKVLDWLEANKAMDPRNVGIAGVSYGGGLALLMAALDPRIKTAVAINAWADLQESLYSHNTMHKDWAGLLVASGAVTGRLDPIILKHLQNVGRGDEIAEFQAWAAERSASSFLDRINERNVPLFLGSSYEDALFSPNQMRSFYQNLHTPKRFYLDHGIHFTAQTPGLFGLSSDVWEETHRWMRHWLVDANEEIREGISMKSKITKEYHGDFVDLSTADEFPLKTRNTVRNDKEQSEDYVSFLAGLDSGASSRVLPLVSGILTSHFDIPVRVIMGQVSRLSAAVYDSEPANELLRLRGSARLQVSLEKHPSPVTLVAYLYATDGKDVGTLISHSVMSEIDKSDELKTYEMDFGIVSFDLPKDQHLSVVIDTVDPLYLSQKNLVPSVRILQGEHAVKLQLPLLR